MSAAHKGLLSAARAHQGLLAAARARPDETRDAIERCRARYGLEDVPTFVAPVVLPRATRDRLAHVAETLHRALARVQRAFFDDGAFRDVLTLPAPLRELAVPVAGDPTLVCCRLDVVASPDGDGPLAVVEVQAGDPSGAGWTDLLWRGLADTPGVRAMAARHPAEEPALIAGQRRAALAVWDTWCRARGERPAPPRVAFACARDALVRSDHEAFATLWREAGLDVVVVDPRDLVVERDTLIADGLPADLLVRDTHDELTGPGFVEATGALRALLARDEVCCVNPLRDALLDDKASFEVLTDPAQASFFTDDERAVIAAHVPRTFRVTEGHADNLRRRREELVLKPADGYGGHDVVLGAFVSDDEWSRAIDAALTRRTVAQDYVPIPRLALPDPGGDDRERYLALSLWVHGGQLSGAYARLSDDPVVNVHRGGGIVPAVFVGE